MRLRVEVRAVVENARKILRKKPDEPSEERVQRPKSNG